jgi:hypothetical protein
VPGLKMFSISQIIGESVYKDDFAAKFSTIDGVVAIDLDQQFNGWKSEIIQSIAIKSAEVRALLDGLIEY